MFTYAVVGGVDLPWFADDTHGFGGPTFAHRLGFIAAAAVTGALAKRGAGRRVPSTVAIMVLGEVVVYAIGTAWLAHDLHLGLVDAFTLGVRLFLVTEAIKIAMASLTFPAGLAAGPSVTSARAAYAPRCATR